MNFIFFWRLTREKGFDLLVRSLRSFDELPGNFFIFGDGTMKGVLFNTLAESPVFEDCSEWDEERLSELLQDSSLRWMSESEWRGNLIWGHAELRSPRSARDDENNTPPWEGGQGGFKIYFFSWRSLDTIAQFLAVSHFSLIPSRFLETFGLSALESLSAGVPVIGFKKWGLVPFIEDSLTITPGETDEQSVQNLTVAIRFAIDTYPDPSEWGVISERAKTVSERYTEDRWIQEVQAFLPEGTKKILLVSDYIAPLGGIETHITDITAALRRHGYTVETFGWHIRKDRFLRIKRLLGLVISCYNLSFAVQLRAYLETYRPDFIWFHNVSRFLGPAVVDEGIKTGIPSGITYHELGVFTPFPSKTEHEEDVPARWSLPLFLSISRSLNIVTHTAIVFKFFQLSWLRRELQQIDHHIVPSAFMRKYVRDILEIPEDRIVTLEHFRG